LDTLYVQVVTVFHLRWYWTPWQDWINQLAVWPSPVW